jgi:hypothetical protein
LYDIPLLNFYRSVKYKFPKKAPLGVWGIYLHF